MMSAIFFLRKRDPKTQKVLYLKSNKDKTVKLEHKYIETFA